LRRGSGGRGDKQCASAYGGRQSRDRPEAAEDHSDAAGFPAASLKKAYETGYDAAYTDDASVAEEQGMSILLIEGEESNFKITTPFDWIVAECWYHHFVKTTE